jgi:hypothetical protein
MNELAWRLFYGLRPWEKTTEYGIIMLIALVTILVLRRL